MTQLSHDLADQNARTRLAGLVMRVDATTAEVIRELRADGVSPILLKGPTVSRWLYARVGDRLYTDTDLLVAPQDLAALEVTLRRLGFAPGKTGWLAHSQEWRRRRELVDIHRTLFGVGVENSEAWTLLSQDPETIEVGGIEVRALRKAARAFHLAIHAAQHDSSFPKPLEDLRRALNSVPSQTWSEAADLARRLAAQGTFAAGLRRVGAAAVLVEMGLDGTRSPPVAILIANESPPTALGLSHLAAATSTKGRVRVLAQALAPRPEYLRSQSSLARRGRRGLGAAYPVRLVRLVWHLPRGLSALRRANEGSGGSNEP